MDKKIYKIKDSVDLFLTDESILTVYYMNTRQRKTFKINEEMVALLELINGIKSMSNIKEEMLQKHGVDAGELDKIVSVLIKNRIITEKIEDKNDTFVKRYSRQINYFAEFFEQEQDGINAQKKIKNTSVTVFGCGAIGGTIALQLAMIGIGKLTLYDFDIEEFSDISRHLFYSKSKVGDKKINVLKSELLMINPEIEVKTIDEYLQPETDIDSIIKNTNFVVNTIDEPYIGYTSMKISKVCMKYKIPHYIAGGFDAHLASTGELVVPFKTPCVACYASYFRKTLKDWKPAKHPVQNRIDEIGGIASMSLFSSSFACIEIIKHILGINKDEKMYKTRGEMHFDDYNLTYLDVKKDDNCEICGRTIMNEA